MTATTGAPWSLVYQVPSDPADISDAIQDLADSVDVAVQSLYDEVALGQSRPAARMASTTSQSIPDSTPTNLTWPAGSEYFDNDGMIDNTITTDRLTFQRTGVYMVAIRCTWAAAVAGGIRDLSVTTSGAPALVARKAQQGINGSDAVTLITTVFPVSAVGEFVTFSAFQTGGIAINSVNRQAQTFRLSEL